MATTPPAPPGGCSACFTLTDMIRRLEDMDLHDERLTLCPAGATETAEAAISDALDAVRALLEAHEAEMGGPQTVP